MHDTLYTAAVIGIIAVMTWITRGLPYVLFSRKAPPPVVNYLGAVLPASIMVILVVYCLRHTGFALPPHGVPELISVALVVLMQVWKKNTIVSILLGTVCYMALIRVI
jgi:branched-subunit amino acid transport protein AzlD